ncbi:protein PEP-RELATED DEVELOPMENT ARRESTED 1, chloroplastic [Telopea speciosissima]|uniref:protein PEP-RELATED DEVELOPMENT ARRESTED 1, chloroplastic n=1 Tax=Telopea speciosissima TaxID=54955 RepID=UPI001CC743BA|nr:protein PEP-RELATED DEVELOPMENT ARRESTED 1, chloroplastic [Telopea speciosissima]
MFLLRCNPYPSINTYREEAELRKQKMLERLAISTTCSCFSSTTKLTTNAFHLPFISSDCRGSFLSFSSRQTKKQTSWITFCNSYEVGGGFPDEGFRIKTSAKVKEDEKWDPSHYEALLKGGEQVTSVLEEMVKLLEDMSMDEASEEAAVELVSQGVIGKRVEEMESGFMMALDYMIQLAEKDNDTQRKSLLEVIKETVLSHLTKKCPPHVQVIGLLCQTPQKESRHELLRRVAAGGGVFKSEKGTKVHLPGANLNDIANQADDLLETMETRPTVPDRKLLARLVLVREEARNMMGGGILDERNDRGLNTLPEAEVNFLTKLVALRPGKNVQEMITNVMQGKDEGADISDNGEEGAVRPLSGGIAGRASVTGSRPLPVRPGMFLETVSKVLGGIYAGNVPGITAQHLEWVHQKTLQVLQEMAF